MKYLQLLTGVSKAKGNLTAWLLSMFMLWLKFILHLYIIYFICNLLITWGVVTQSLEPGAHVENAQPINYK